MDLAVEAKPQSVLAITRLGWPTAPASVVSAAKRQRQSTEARESSQRLVASSTPFNMHAVNGSSEKAPAEVAGCTQPTLPRFQTWLADARART